MSVYSFTDAIIALTRLSYNLFLIGLTAGIASAIGGVPGALIGASLMGVSLSAVIVEDFNRFTFNGATILRDLSKPFTRRRQPRRYKQQTRVFQRRPVVQNRVQTVPLAVQQQQSVRQSIQNKKNKYLRSVRRHVLPVVLLRRKRRIPTDDRKMLEMQRYRKSIEVDKIFFGKVSERQRF